MEQAGIGDVEPLSNAGVNFEEVNIDLKLPLWPTAGNKIQEGQGKRRPGPEGFKAYFYPQTKTTSLPKSVLCITQIERGVVSVDGGSVGYLIALSVQKFSDKCVPSSTLKASQVESVKWLLVPKQVHELTMGL